MAVKKAVEVATKEVATEVKDFALNVNEMFDKEVDELAGDLQKSKVSGWILAGCGIALLVIGGLIGRFVIGGAF